MSNRKDIHSLNEIELAQVSGGAAEQAGKADVFNKIQSILAAKFDISAGSVGMHSSIIDDLGADSLDVVDILKSTEDQFQIKINQAELGSVKSVEDFCKLVNKSL